MVELLASPWLGLLPWIRIAGKKDDLLFRCYPCALCPTHVVSMFALDVKMRNSD